VRFLTIAIGLALSSIACSHDGSKPPLGVNCPLNLFTPGIVVEVRDAATGEPAASGAQGSIHDLAYTESLVPYGVASPDVPLSLAGAFNRGGTYDVQVHKSGYIDWTAQNVAVLEDHCGVVTVTLAADLMPMH
jgi:hypothetical protein